MEDEVAAKKCDDPFISLAAQWLSAYRGFQIAESEGRDELKGQQIIPPNEWLSMNTGRERISRSQNKRFIQIIENLASRDGNVNLGTMWEMSKRVPAGHDKWLESQQEGHREFFHKLLVFFFFFFFLIIFFPHLQLGLTEKGVRAVLNDKLCEPRV